MSAPWRLDVPDDQTALRRAFGTFATGVTVVTVGGGTPHGMTANSFTTVSLDPPLVLVCVRHAAVMHRSLAAVGRFAVSVLAAHQERLARHFADSRRPAGIAQFDGIDWRPGPSTGAPLIVGALAHFECGLWRRYPGGDHSMILGRLLTAEMRTAGDPLLFNRGRFRPLGSQEPDGSSLALRSTPA
jgi:flavin reductase